MKSCPACGSKELYEYKKFFQYGGQMGEELLPKIAPVRFLSVAKIRPTVCAECGHIALFASEDARKKLGKSEHWKPASPER
jgi:DNA-directed RNA polymerase subunit RPC12/RpoP